MQVMEKEMLGHYHSLAQMVLEVRTLHGASNQEKRV